MNILKKSYFLFFINFVNSSIINDIYEKVGLKDKLKNFENIEKNMFPLELVKNIKFDDSNKFKVNLDRDPIYLYYRSYYPNLSDFNLSKLFDSILSSLNKSTNPTEISLCKLIEDLKKSEYFNFLKIKQLEFSHYDKDSQKFKDFSLEIILDLTLEKESDKITLHNNILSFKINNNTLQIITEEKDFEKNINIYKKDNWKIKPLENTENESISNKTKNFIKKNKLYIICSLIFLGIIGYIYLHKDNILLYIPSEETGNTKKID